MAFSEAEEFVNEVKIPVIGLLGIPIDQWEVAIPIWSCQAIEFWEDICPDHIEGLAGPDFKILINFL